MPPPRGGNQRLSRPLVTQVQVEEACGARAHTGQGRSGLSFDLSLARGDQGRLSNPPGPAFEPRIESWAAMRSEPLRNTCTRVFGIIEKDDGGRPVHFSRFEFAFSPKPNVAMGIHRRS